MGGTHRWSELRRAEIKALGKKLVEQRLQGRGCTVVRDRDARSGRSVVHGRSRETELYVSTQRVGGYAFWTKRRLRPAAAHRYAVLALLQEGEAPALYIIPTLDWLEPSPPLASRDHVGQASEPEDGVEPRSRPSPALDVLVGERRRSRLARAAAARP